MNEWMNEWFIFPLKHDYFLKWEKNLLIHNWVSINELMNGECITLKQNNSFIGISWCPECQKRMTGPKPGWLTQIN